MKGGFHVVTTIALALLMATTLLDGIAAVVNKGDAASLVFSVLILIMAIRTWMCKKSAFVFMAILFVCRLLYVDTASSTAYSYLLGGNFAKLLRDFLPFLASLFIKKDGVSGWRVLFGPEVNEEKENKKDAEEDK